VCDWLTSRRHFFYFTRNNTQQKMSTTDALIAQVDEAQRDLRRRMKRTAAKLEARGLPPPEGFSEMVGAPSREKQGFWCGGAVLIAAVTLALVFALYKPASTTPLVYAALSLGVLLVVLALCALLRRQHPTLLLLASAASASAVGFAGVSLASSAPSSSRSAATH
jgi:hypothetical protein